MKKKPIRIQNQTKILEFLLLNILKLNRVSLLDDIVPLKALLILKGVNH